MSTTNGGVSSLQLDALDRLAAKTLDGFIVRKDLVRKYSRQFPLPTYVVEFLLGRYCASIDEKEIAEGLEIVEKQLEGRTVRTGDQELFKARARENGSIKLIDIVKARLDAKNDRYVAELPSLGLRDVPIPDDEVKQNERMLTDGFYAEVELEYDALAAQAQGGTPFKIGSLRAIQMSSPDVLDRLATARRSFTTAEWVDFLIRSIGIEPNHCDDRAKRVTILRMVPFVERNYNMVELGPRGTGKSHLFQQISPYSHLISGGKATVAKMFVNNANGQRGLVCLYDVVCFDEVSGISFDSKDGVNIMKGYMASGQFSRGKDQIVAEGSIAMVGNFEVDVQQQQKIGHLLSPLPPEMRGDTAFHDRIHAYIPGWDFPKVKPGEHLTDHFGMVSDFLSECWSRMRQTSRASVMQGRVQLGGALSGRDIDAVNKTVSGLTKLLFPGIAEVPDEDLEYMLRIGLESRRRIKEQQKRCLKSEFRNTHFSYSLIPDGVEQFVSTPELHSDDAIDSDPLPPGQVWAVSPGGHDSQPGLFRIEATVGPGNGAKILNQPVPAAFRESVRMGEQNLYTNAKVLVGDREPRAFEYSIQLRAMDNDRNGSGIGLPVLVALTGTLLQKNTQGATIIVGHLNLGGSIELIPNAVSLVELAVDKQAARILMPISARRQLNDLPDEVWTKISIEFYKDSADAVFKALDDK
jgi:ATP-dependent Lon protease